MTSCFSAAPPSWSVTRRPIVRGAAEMKVTVAVAPVASSYAPSPSRSQASAASRPSGSVDCEVNVTGCSCGTGSGVKVKAATGSRLSTAIESPVVAVSPSSSVTRRPTVRRPGVANVAAAAGVEASSNAPSSSRSHAHATIAPSGSVPIPVNVTDCPVSGVAEEGVIAADGGMERTVTVAKATCSSRPSSTVSVAWKVPAAG